MYTGLFPSGAATEEVFYVDVTHTLAVHWVVGQLNAPSVVQKVIFKGVAYIWRDE